MEDPMEMEEEASLDGLEEFDDPEPDPNFYRYVKRVPQRPATRKEDVYITRHSRSAAVIERCEALLREGKTPIIHALGAAINSAVDLSLDLVSRSGGAIVPSVNTSTETLYDDYQPLIPGLDPITRMRNNSAVHIRLVKK